MAEEHMTMLTSPVKVVLTTIQEGMGVTGTLSAAPPTTTQATGLETASQAHMESSIRPSRQAEDISSAVEGPIVIMREVAITTAMKTAGITPLGGRLSRAAVFQMPGMARTRRVLTILETGTTGTVHTEIGHQETDLQERRTPHTLNSTHGIPTTEIGTGILGTVITSLARSAVQDMIVNLVKEKIHNLQEKILGKHHMEIIGRVLYRMAMTVQIRGPTLGTETIQEILRKLYLEHKKLHSMVS